jgi:hypothetical protein
MHVTYNSFRSAFSPVTCLVSLAEEIETKEAFEEFACSEALEDSAAELAFSRSRHLRHGATNSS